MSREKIKELGDVICEYCPFIKGEVSHSIGRPCEGDYCEEAYENYCEEQENNQNNEN